MAQVSDGGSLAGTPSSSYMHGGGGGVADENRSKSDYLVVQTFQKVLDVILLARVDARHPSEGLKRSGRTKFNLDLPELGSVREILAPWAATQIHTPLALDIFGPAESFCSNAAERPKEHAPHVLLERWYLSYRPPPAAPHQAYTLAAEPG
eukprot:CAMPEP_0118868302 /NCGR_PEP_ID=MMETSP1163-20130328/11773_1 /TAXON_ID=124430 /ORGANISM="Phaeomonas parva, Strain CCMP2877" /LENGTH=150 /DNA_ID=CAMNT_0006802941 /DNA_START=165 /DNA_END=613 /DNA_ORIENTATION=+